MIIELSEIEQNLAKIIAQKRFSNNRNNNIKNSKRGSQSDETTDLEGIAAEIAFCKIHNIYPDFTIFTRSTKSDKGDARLANGMTVDIKTTKYINGKLIAVPWKEPNVDLFALMVGTFPKYEFKGFMQKLELLNPKRLGNLGYGETYIAYQHELELDLKKINVSKNT